MTKKLRLLGVTFIAVGIILFFAYLIPSFRALWPLFRTLPVPLQVGTGVLFSGGVLVIISLVIERFEHRDYDRHLRDDD
jgi:polyferredoxin